MGMNVRGYVLTSVVFTVFVLSFNVSLAYSQPSNAHLSFDQHPMATGHSGLIQYYNSSLAGNGHDNPVTISVASNCYSPSFILNLNESPYDDGYFYSAMITYHATATCPATTSPVATDPSITLNVLENKLINVTSVSIPGTMDSLNVTSAGPSTIPWAYTKADYDWADCANFGGDTDSDNICNDWEDQTMHASKGLAGGVWVNYPYVGDLPTDMYHYPCDASGCPSPDRKDIYLELDWMTNHRPDPNAMGNVTEAFANAPINFPNGTHAGIKLHIQDNGIGDELNDVTTGIIFPGINHPRYQPGFDQVKAVFFGSETERTANATAWTEFQWKQKKQIFHYGMFVHSQRGAPGSSGDAEVWGNDLMVATGGWSNATSPQFQAGSLMHELGHNLKLQHGGADSDLINCKPNYLSVMSYSLQLPILDPHRQLNYSGFAHDPLDTNALIESVGVNPNPNGVSQSVVFGPVMPSGNWITNGGWIDWNANGVIDTNTVQEYINFLPDEGCMDSEHDILMGHDDWNDSTTGINLNSRGTGNWAEGRMINECSFPGRANTANPNHVVCLPVDRPVGPNHRVNVNTASTVSDVYRDRVFASGVSTELTFTNYLHQLSSTVELLNDNIQNLDATDFVNDEISSKEYYQIESENIQENILVGDIDTANALLIDMRKTFDADSDDNKIFYLSAKNNNILSRADNSLLAHANSLEPALGNPSHGVPAFVGEKTPEVVCDSGDVRVNNNRCVPISDFCGVDTRLVNDICVPKPPVITPRDPSIWGILGPIFGAGIAIMGIVVVALGWKLRRHDQPKISAST